MSISADDPGLTAKLMNNRAFCSVQVRKEKFYLSSITIQGKYQYIDDQCCGSGMFIPDPIFSHPGFELSPSRIRIKEFKYLTPKNQKMVSKL
jgi:hypothetical protein